MGVFLGGTYYCKYKRNYSGLLSLAPPQDSAGECDSEAKRRHSQDRGKPCPYYTTARQARPSYSRGTPCGYPGTLPTVIRQQSPQAGGGRRWGRTPPPPT